MHGVARGALAAALGWGAAAGALGAFDLAWDTRRVDALDLGADGRWTEGEEWSVNPSAGTIDLFERWIGGPGSSVELWTALTVGTIPPTARAPLAIARVRASIVNETDFAWNEFRIDLFAGPSATIADLGANATTQFATVSVLDRGAGWFTILWRRDGGAGVELRGVADISFSFRIEGLASFTQVQTPIPVPGAAVFGLAGLAALRRRR